MEIKNQQLKEEDEIHFVKENQDLNSQDDSDNDEIDPFSKDPQKSKKNEKRGRIFIKNLPFKLISQEELKSSLVQYGEITDINLPVNEKGESKGFGFVQFKTKREALKAIKEATNLKFGGRKVNLSLALTKEEYKEKEQEIQLKEKEEKLLRKKRDKSTKKIEEEKEGENESENKPKRPLLNDPSRTLFVRNLGFNTDELKLKEFFQNYGPVLYAKIVRDKNTKVSKGTGFVMFHHKEDLDSVLELYNTHSKNYENNKKNKFNNDKRESSSGLNPFELDDRHLYLFQAMSKENAQEMEKQQNIEKNKDKRNRELLYYGLSEATVKYFKEENQEISEEDKEKREALIKLKKLDFTKNPNLHVSTTRITIRNLDKNVDEDKLREIIREKLNEYEKSLKDEEKKEYNKVKKIKQIKLLRNSKELDKENQPKSKCVAFIEVCDLKVAKALINLMSNLNINKKSKKGLIIDFSLDDIRKIQTRLNKIKQLKEKKREKAEEVKENAANGDKKFKKPGKNSENSGQNNETLHENNEIISTYNSQIKKKPINNPENSIENISDVNVLLNLYTKTVSRGKKQRIKKKLKKLGVNPPPTLETKLKEIDNKNDFFKKSSNNTNDVYLTTKIENEKTNINKKIQEGINKAKSLKSGEKNQNQMLKNKRNRNQEKESMLNNKNRKVEMTQNFMKNSKNLKHQTQPNHKNSKKSFEYDNFSESDDMDDDMNPYYSQILQNLNKK